VERPFYLAIEGVIGVGKTTLARLLQPRFNADLLLEVFEENPFLSHFYTDRERYAFQTQIFFLLSRYRQQQNVRLNDRPLIADYTFAKDRLFAHLNLRGDELVMYERVHQALAEKVLLPDLVVYLRASLETLMARIAMRDRPYERGIDPGYIESVRQAYEQHFAQYDVTPLLVVETDDLDFVRWSEDLDYVEGLIRTALSEAEVRAHIEATAEGSVETHPRWRAIEEFLALSKAVGALGAALSSNAGEPPEGAREALDASAQHLERLRQLLQGGHE